MKRKIIALGVAILCMLSVIGLTACTPAELLALQGTLKNVDNVTGNITLNMKDGTTQTFNFHQRKGRHHQAGAGQRCVRSRRRM